MIEALSCELLTRKDVAKTLKVSLVTIDKWKREGVINAYKIGGRIRFKSNEIESFLKTFIETSKQ